MLCPVIRRLCGILKSVPPKPITDTITSAYTKMLDQQGTRGNTRCKKIFLRKYCVCIQYENEETSTTICFRVPLTLVLCIFPNACVGVLRACERESETERG